MSDVDAQGHVIRLWDVSQRERDATYFEQTATAGVQQATSVTAALTGAALDTPSSGSISMRVGESSSIKVHVTGDLGVCDGDSNTELLRRRLRNTGIEGLVVELSVSEVSIGISLVPENTSANFNLGDQYVAETDSSGVASVTVTGNVAGSYTVTATVRQIVPSGNTGGGMLRAFSIPVEVTP